MPGDTWPTHLDLNVTTETRHGRTQLSYMLHSPIAGLIYHQIHGPELLGDSAAYSAGILRKIEQLAVREDVDGSFLLPEDIGRKLANLGQDLYRELFPPDLPATLPPFPRQGPDADHHFRRAVDSVGAYQALRRQRVRDHRRSIPV